MIGDDVEGVQGPVCISKYEKYSMWPISKNSKKTKVVALHCSFQNLFELCSKVLLLWRYEVKVFKSTAFFFVFFAFFLMKTTPNNMISPHLES